MRFVRVIKVLGIAAAVMMLAAGAFLPFFSPGFDSAACCILGGLFIVTGAVRICGYFSKDLYRLAFQFDLAAGLFLILTGAVLIFMPQRIYMAFPIVGFFTLIDGLLRLQTSLDARRFGVRTWWVILALGVCSVVLGALILLYSLKNADRMIWLLGMALVVTAAESLYLILTTVRVARKDGK